MRDLPDIDIDDEPVRRHKRGGCDSGSILGNPHLPSTGGTTDAACFASTMSTWGVSCGLVSALPGSGWCGVLALSTVMQTLLYDDSNNKYTTDEINQILDAIYVPEPGRPSQGWQACDFTTSAGLGVSRLRGCLLTIINSINLLQAQILETQNQVQTLLAISRQQQANFASLTAQVTEINMALQTQASIASQAAYAQV